MAVLALTLTRELVDAVPMRALGIVLVLTSLSALAQDEGRVDDCGLEPPGSYVAVPVPTRQWEPVLTPDSPALVRGNPSTAPRIGGVPNASARGAGPLANKVIYLSPGHGFTWDPGSNNWRTQRGNNNDIVEDLVSIETLSQFVMPMLLNAGARVVPVRELDLNTGLVIVDDDGAGYVESGAGFITSSLTGFAPITPPISGDLLPFSAGHNLVMVGNEGVVGEDGSAAAAAAVRSEGCVHRFVHCGG